MESAAYGFHHVGHRRHLDVQHSVAWRSKQDPLPEICAMPCANCAEGTRGFGCEPNGGADDGLDRERLGPRIRFGDRNPYCAAHRPPPELECRTLYPLSIQRHLDWQSWS